MARTPRPSRSTPPLDGRRGTGDLVPINRVLAAGHSLISAGNNPRIKSHPGSWSIQGSSRHHHGHPGNAPPSRQLAVRRVPAGFGPRSGARRSGGLGPANRNAETGPEKLSPPLEPEPRRRFGFAYSIAQRRQKRFVPTMCLLPFCALAN